MWSDFISNLFFVNLWKYDQIFKIHSFHNMFQVLQTNMRFSAVKHLKSVQNMMQTSVFTAHKHNIQSLILAISNSSETSQMLVSKSDRKQSKYFYFLLLYSSTFQSQIFDFLLLSSFISPSEQWKRFSSL